MFAAFFRRSYVLSVDFIVNSTANLIYQRYLRTVYFKKGQMKTLFRFGQIKLLVLLVYWVWLPRLLAVNFPGIYVAYNLYVLFPRSDIRDSSVWVFSGNETNRMGGTFRMVIGIVFWLFT